MSWIDKHDWPPRQSRVPDPDIRDSSIKFYGQTAASSFAGKRRSIVMFLGPGPCEEECEQDNGRQRRAGNQQTDPYPPLHCDRVSET